MSDNYIYLDHAAATPLDERVFRAMKPYFNEQFYNPSSAYTPARQVRATLDDAKHRLAMVIGGQKSEIILTAGATESINIAIHGVMKPGHNCVIGATEHQAVRGVASVYNMRIATADNKGIVSAESVKAQIDDNTSLVSVTAADSELGVVQPLKQIAEVLRQIRADRLARGIKTPLIFHSDASQALGQIDVHTSRLGIDLLSLNAAKCYGPKQVGLLWVRSGVVLTPYLRGGGQEQGLRSGTENVAGAVGFAVAAEYALKNRHDYAHKLALMRDNLQAELTSRIPDLLIDGHQKRRLPGHLHISLKGLDAERVVFALDAMGVLVATGAACAANKGTRSSTLVGIGMSDEQADGSLRLSLGRLNKASHIPRVAELIATAIDKERRL